MRAAELTNLSPVLVMGMHNSGTRMLAEVIHTGGIFLHANMAHFESEFFSIRLNDQLILKDTSAWAQLPLIPIDEVMSHRDEIARIIATEWLETYTRDGYDGTGPWGFKDPRLCLILPLYLNLFPRARLIYIRRDPDRIAHSLAQKKKRGVGVLKDAKYWRELTVAYMDRAEAVLATHPDSFTLQYEELCRRPLECGRALFAFLGFPLNDYVRGFLTEKIRTDRI